MSLALTNIDALWRGALAVVPLVVLAAMICRFLPCRPSTRHSLWLMVMLMLVAAPLLPQLNAPGFVQELFATVGSSEFPVPNSESATIPDRARNSELETRNSLGPPSARAAREPFPPDEHTVDLGPSPARAVFQEPSPMGLRPSEKVPFSSIDDLVAAATSDFGSRVLDFGLAPERRSGDNHAVVNGAVASTVYGDTLGALPRSSLPPAVSNPKSKIQNPKSADNDVVVTAGDTRASEWSAWFARLRVLRDALSGLTPLPARLWLIGLIALAFIMSIRAWRFTRVLRSAEPAPGDVRRMVLEVGGSLGLRAAPRTLMVNRSISPLVWCGRRRLLILPIPLWSELDDVGRRAVLLHELAHLRRRDHWVCWLELIACTLYWWNPVVWWVRGKIRDEADMCCDAWVTAMLPHSRSTYARALLATRQHLLHAPHAVPAVGLGMTTARSKRFARRLTMVMTERNAPRLSLTGAILAVSLAAATWLASPLWACPPEEKEAKHGPAAKAPAAPKAPKAPREAKAAKEPKAPRAPIAVMVAPTAPVPRTPDAAPEPGTTYEQHMRERGEGDDDLVRRIDRLEERLDRLTEHLEQLMGVMGGPGAGGQPAPPPQPGSLPRSAPPGRGVGGAVSGPAGQAPTVRGRVSVGGGATAGPLTATTPMPSQPGFAGSARNLAAAVSAPGEVIVRTYKLPEGKLEAFTELLIRQDVPILVAPQDRAIEVHATPAQHEVVAAFILIIDPDNESVRSQPGGASRRLQELDYYAALGGTAVAGDVARKALAEAHAAMQSAGLDKAAMEAYRAEIERALASAGGVSGEVAKEAIAKAQAALEKSGLDKKAVEEYRAAMEKMGLNKRAAGAARAQAVESLRQTLQQRRQQGQNERRQVEQHRRQLEQRMRELEREAERLEEEADNKEGPESDALRAQSEALAAQAAEVEAQSDELEARIEAMEADLEALMEQIEAEIESQLEQQEQEQDKDGGEMR